LALPSLGASASGAAGDGGGGGGSTEHSVMARGMHRRHLVPRPKGYVSAAFSGTDQDVNPC